MTFLLEILRLGLHNLRLHKLRSILTSLGIILGVAAVIVMVAIGEGNKQAALRNIQALGATNIIVRSIKPPETTSMSQTQTMFLARYGITRQDLRRLQEHMKHAVHIVPLKAVGDEMMYRDKRRTSQAFGVTPELQEVANLRLAQGRYISPEDMIRNRPVAVIGAEVAQQFFPNGDPVGEVLRIKDQVVQIVGVLKPIGLAGGAGSPLVGRNLNMDVHIPMTTAEAQFGDQIQRRVAGSFQNEEVQLSEIYITSDSTENVIRDAALVKQIIMTGHSGTSDVELIVPWELLEEAKRQLRMWNIVLTFIASISLLVGGIGIMNIMLASVTERTREIGIRRALGATRKHIVWQFLVETGTLSAVGGIAGILVGIGFSLFVGKGLPKLLQMPIFRSWFQTKINFETEVTLWSILVSFIVAAFVGLVFGIYPAVVASKQDPIVALRHD